MRRSLITLLFLPAALTAAWAQPVKATLDFGSDGARQIWQRPSSSPAEVGKPVSVTGISAEMELEPGKIVGVYDETTGKAAEKPADEIIKDKAWKLKPEDFTRLGRLEVTIAHDFKPVAAGQVKVTAGAESRDSLLTPGDKGKLEFWNLPLKALTLTFITKLDGQEVKTPAMTVSPAPSKGGMAVSLPVSEKVETLAGGDEKKEEASGGQAQPASKEEADEKKPQPTGSNPLGTFVSLIIGLAILGALGYAVYAYFKGSPDQAKDLLKKAGLDPDAAQQAAQAQAPTAPAPAPLQKIVLDNAAPTPASPAGVSMAPAAAAVSPALGRRLVGANGESYAISEGETKLGREGADIVFGSDSGVSRNHAAIQNSGGQMTITDLGSTNGTYVNGVKITSPTSLKAGDLVILGTVRLRCE